MNVVVVKIGVATRDDAIADQTSLLISARTAIDRDGDLF